MVFGVGQFNSVIYIYL